MPIVETISIIIGTVIPAVGATWGVMHFVYKRGFESGMDSECERRIKNKITDLEKKLDQATEHGDRTHKEIKDQFEDVHIRITKTQNDVSEIKGSINVVKDLVVKHLGR